MPADFLNAEQCANYGQFSGEPNDIQLVRFFLLGEVDMDFINHRRGRANRLRGESRLLLPEPFVTGKKVLSAWARGATGAGDQCRRALEYHLYAGRIGTFA